MLSMTNNKDYAEKHRKANRQKYNEAQQRYEKRKRGSDIYKLRIKRYRTKLREDVLKGYGNKCACCGESEPLFLEIDHVNNDGFKDSRRIIQIYSWIRRNNYPASFQILCCNCNRGKYKNGGVCPHKS